LLRWDEATDLQRRAVVEAIRFEGWAGDEAEVTALVDDGGVTLSSAHERGGAAPAGTAVSPSTPVLCFEDRGSARRVWSAIAATVPAAPAASALEARVARRVLLRDVVAPSLDRAIDVAGTLELLPHLAEALHRGDDLAARTDALRTLLATELSRHLVRSGLPRGELALVLDHLAMDSAVAAAVALGAARSIAEAARGVAGSTLVVAMAQGGRSFGVRVAGLGAAWATAQLDPGAIADDDDLGDRPVAECVGLGGFAMPAAPALLAAVGGRREEIAERVLSMRSITSAAHPRLTVPLLGFEGVRVGIDVRRVVETGITPVLAVDDVEVGPRGAPAAAFEAALEAFAASVGLDAHGAGAA
jgi:hypothetical protein